MKDLTINQIAVYFTELKKKNWTNEEIYDFLTKN